MRILVISTTCSSLKYQEIYEKRVIPMLDSNQKFFLSLIEGMRANENVSVDCVTSLPISYSCYRQRFVRSEDECVDGVEYHYCGCVNFPVVRTITVGYRIRSYVRKYLSEHSDEKVVVLCDGLLGEANSLVSMLRKKGIPSIALVTDIPNVVSDMERGNGVRSFLYSIYGERTTKLLRRFDGYVFLTEQMNELCNPEEKPYMIMECIATPIDIDKIPCEKLSERPVALYAGKLHSDFGVLELAKASEYLKGVCDIWLYGGHGDCDLELQNIANKNENLKLHGIVSQSEIHRIERNSNILVNPRPNQKNFTKYSFPSKTAEYLMMNVPVVMYKLDGIPDEYDNYLHYIEGNTPEDIARKIIEVLHMDPARTEENCNQGRDYIIKSKNNIAQAKRLIEFIKDVKVRNRFAKDK